ncbi:hypothetical protein HDU96_006467 [Phlyctochytrium bullatum]|nr:hypothetical protein HDU96_006467 [Phlyctochytrium bullatum]
MIPVPIAEIVVGLISTIIEIRGRIVTTNDSVNRLIARVESLEISTVALTERYNGMAEVFETALLNLVKVLEACQEVLSKIASKNAFGRGMKLLMYQDRLEKLEVQLEACILDLQLSLKTDELLNKQQIPEKTAETIAVALEAMRSKKNLEPVLVCVQCGQTYRDSENADGDCTFHSAQVYDRPSYYDYVLPCCRKKIGSEFIQFPPEGCTKGRHVAAHHTCGTYLNYLGRWTPLLRGADIWYTVSQRDYSSDVSDEVSANVGLLPNGQIAFWACQSHVPLRVVTFEPEDLEIPTVFPDEWPLLEFSESKTPLNSTWNKEVLRKGGSWSAKASWIVVDRQICGVRLEAKSPTGAVPNESMGRVRTIYDDALDISDLTPSSDPSRVLPSPTKAFEDFPRHCFEASGVIYYASKITGDEENEAAQASETAEIRLKQVGPVFANPDGSSWRADIFRFDLLLLPKKSRSPFPTEEERLELLRQVTEGTLSVRELEKTFSTGLAPQSEPEDLIFIDPTVDASFDEGKTWIKSDGLQVSLTGNAQEALVWPLKMASTDILKLSFEPWFSTEGKKRNWTGSSFLARKLPHAVLLRLMLETVDGKRVSIQLPYRNPPMREFAQENPLQDYLFVHVDDLDDQDRVYAKSGVSTNQDVTSTMLRQWIHKAKRSFVESGSDPKHFAMVLEDLNQNGVEVKGLFDLSNAERPFLWAVGVKVTLGETGLFSEKYIELPAEMFES